MLMWITKNCLIVSAPVSVILASGVAVLLASPIFIRYIRSTFGLNWPTWRSRAISSPDHGSHLVPPLSNETVFVMARCSFSSSYTVTRGNVLRRSLTTSSRRPDSDSMSTRASISPSRSRDLRVSTWRIFTICVYGTYYVIQCKTKPEQCMPSYYTSRWLSVYSRHPAKLVLIFITDADVHQNTIHLVQSFRMRYHHGLNDRCRIIICFIFRSNIVSGLITNAVQHLSKIPH